MRAVYPYDVRSTQRRVGPGLYAIARFTGETGVFVSCAAPLNYRLIIASEHPLRLDRLRGEVSFALRPAPSNFFFASAGFGGTVDRLVEDLVPEYPAGPGPEWATYWETQLFDRGLCQRPGPVDALLGARAIALLQSREVLRMGEPTRGTTGEETDEEASPIAPEPPLVPKSLPALEETGVGPRVAVEKPYEVEGVYHAPTAFRSPEPYRASDTCRSPVRLPDDRYAGPLGGAGGATWLRGGTYTPRDATRLSGRDRGFPTLGGARSLPSRGFGSTSGSVVEVRRVGSSRSGPHSPRALPSTRTRPTGVRGVQPTRGTNRTAPNATGSSGGGKGTSGIKRASGRRKPDGP